MTKLAPTPPEIGDHDGFKATDLFGYKAFGERMADMIESLEDPSVIVLDGQWGSGKSTFVKQWAGLLRGRGNAVVYFDAFENDHHDDAFFVLAGEFEAHAEEKLGQEDSPSDFVNISTRVGKGLLPIAARMGLSQLTGLSSDDVKKLTDVLKQSETELLQEKISTVNEQREAVGKFQQELAALSRKLREQAGNNKDGEPAPLVFIIDELDRCKPTFALNMLERVKHLFQVEGICFVLVVDLLQIEKTVEAAYGFVNAHAYLEKFYQRHLVLPLEKNVGEHHERYLGFLADHFVWSNHVDQRERQELIERICDLSRVHKLSLRTLERLSSSVFSIYNSGDYLRNPYRIFVMVALCTMRVVDFGLYQKVRRGLAESDEVEAFMHYDRWPYGRSGVDIKIRKLWPFLLNGTAADDRDEETMRKSLSCEICGQDEIKKIIPDMCDDIDFLTASFPEN